MAAADNKQPANYGFLTIVEIDQLGFCGGLLVLTPRGRPVEFHCTAPVAANRAQQILFGRTLKEFICCEQIGVSLIQKVKNKLDLILVADPSMLSLAQYTDLPVIAVVRPEDSHENHSHAEEDRVDNLLEIQGQCFCVAGGISDQAAELLEDFVGSLPASEPFERIHLAITEAHSKAA